MIPPLQRDPPPRLRAGKTRTIAALLAGAALLQLLGFGLIFARSRGIDLLPSWDKTQQKVGRGEVDSKPVSVNQSDIDKAADGDLPAEAGLAPKRRFREQPIEDNLPEVDLIAGTKPGGTVISAGQDAGEVKIALPAGPTPSEVSLVSGPVVSKCWDEKGFQQDGPLCNPVPPLGEVLLQRLYIAEACRKEISGETNTGTLSLGIEADFLRNALSFFAKEGSTIQLADQLIACLNQRLGRIALTTLAHRFARYHLGAKIKFGIKPSQTVLPGQVATKDVAEIEAALKTAKEIAVTRDRVRVRKTPVDGEIIGFISAPRKVRLIEQNGDWCLVKTGGENLGWMVCWALGIGPVPAE